VLSSVLILVEKEMPPLALKETAIGIELGLKTVVVASDSIRKTAWGPGVRPKKC
jgi:hypothetical protein